MFHNVRTPRPGFEPGLLPAFLNYFLTKMLEVEIKDFSLIRDFVPNERAVSLASRLTGQYKSERKIVFKALEIVSNL